MNLEVTVLDYDMLGGSDPIGKVVLGKNRKKLEKKHWVEMIENPRRPIIHWHVLKVIIFDMVMVSLSRKKMPLSKIYMHICMQSKL